MAELKQDKFHLDNGEITFFRRDPLENYGSVSRAHGLKVEVQAVVIHMFCRFDKEVFEDAPKYFFVY